MSNLLEYIQRIWIWLRRISYCRGFGVQSPSDYSFVRYVINEHWPYYAYSSLSSEWPDVKGSQLRVAQLYFRVSNFCQADVILDLEPFSEVLTRYLHEGCHHSHLVHSVFQQHGFKLARFNILSFDWNAINALLDLADNQSVLLIENIHKNIAARCCWQRIVLDSRTGVCFDLFDVGIVFFDKKRYKHCYIINF